MRFFNLGFHVMSNKNKIVNGKLSDKDNLFGKKKSTATQQIFFYFVVFFTKKC